MWGKKDRDRVCSFAGWVVAGFGWLGFLFLCVYRILMLDL